ncbi:MAG: hypothetical protein JW840_07925 [Candidatus Thermoplasmatota archaeon]|nr:hypothetical protein [Candidatus Thermoplasmatota archaeon]
MEKKEIKRLYNGRWAILFAGIVSIFSMITSEYGDNAFRWSFVFLIVGITIFMFEVTTFIAYFLSNK